MKDLVSHVNEFLGQADFDWCICGGYAIDLFAGHNTRPHQNIDIAVFWEDKKKIISYMLDANWRVFEAYGGGAVFEIIDISDCNPEKRNVFCFERGSENCQLKPIGNDMFQLHYISKEQNKLDYIEFLFNCKTDDTFVYAPNQTITHEMRNTILKPAGVPFFAPEIVLLYKSMYVEYLGKDDEFAFRLVSNSMYDFNLLLPLLGSERKAWLKKALRTVYPSGHAWIRRLDLA
jgi:hypothetical protein